MLAKTRLAWNLARHFGLGWLAYRATYAVQQRLGSLKRLTPSRAWSAQPLGDWLTDKTLADPCVYGDYRRKQAPAFVFDPAQRQAYQPLFSRWDTDHQSPVSTAEAIRHGQFQYFEADSKAIGFPPDWQRNPFTNQRIPANRHWSQISDFDFGDIKLIWEVNRFGFTFSLVRAYWRTADERYAEWFWQLVEDWAEHNPPYQGPNWKCGQETSLRVLAWCFGLYGFRDARATTPERIVRLAQLIAVSGARVEANLNYALSLHNNHGISEGLGLWLIGRLFPEFRRATQWEALGRQVLETQAHDLIAPDGSFSQHSTNYHRLMLQDYLVAIRLAEAQSVPFSPALYDRLQAATHWLYQLQDETSGEMPNYGHNDGALILPLTNCAYPDFRPVVQVAYALFFGARPCGTGSWDEAVLWLCGPTALTLPKSVEPRIDFRAPQGGYVTLRTPEGMLVTRAARFRHRPSQADQLHVDLWWKGHNIALDPGTYSYNAPAPWNNSLGDTAYHNTVLVDHQDQMDRAGKFLWLPWSNGKTLVDVSATDGSPLTYWEGTHDGYSRIKPAVAQRRGVLRLGGGYWLVLDWLQSSRPHTYRLHWLLGDWAYQLNPTRDSVQLETPAGSYSLQVGASQAGQVSLVRADPNSPRGWQAPYYQHRQPALSLAFEVNAADLLFWSLFGPTLSEMAHDSTALQINLKDALARIEWADNPHTVGAITFTTPQTHTRLLSK